MSENKISELPKSIYDLKKLEELDLSENTIFNLEKTDINWKDLKKLNLSKVQKNYNFYVLKCWLYL